VSGQLAIDGHVLPARVCACGCGCSLDEMRRDAIWHSRACAVGWARAHPGKSLNDAHSANKGRTRKRRTAAERGLQVSFWKAVEVLHAELGSPRLAIELALEQALPSRQREILEHRERTA
jgi:hypothetical protein